MERKVQFVEKDEKLKFSLDEIKPPKSEETDEKPLITIDQKLYSSEHFNDLTLRKEVSDPIIWQKRKSNGSVSPRAYLQRSRENELGRVGSVTPRSSSTKGPDAPGGALPRTVSARGPDAPPGSVSPRSPKESAHLGSMASPRPGSPEHPKPRLSKSTRTNPLKDTPPDSGLRSPRSPRKSPALSTPPLLNFEEIPNSVGLKTSSDLYVSKSKSIQFVLFTKLRSGALVDPNEVTKMIASHPSFKFYVNDLDESSGQTLLFLACRNGDTLLVDLLLKIDGINVNGVQDKFSDTTPLHVATLGGHVEIVAMLLASKAVPQYAGVYHVLPQKEVENSTADKEKKKRMEDLWKVYNKKKNGVEMFLPPGKTLNEYKPQEPHLSLETMITGLTSEGNHRTAVALYFGTVTSSGEEIKKKIKLMDLLLVHRLYCKPEELLNLLIQRFYQTKEIEIEMQTKVKVLNVIMYWVTDLWQEFMEQSLRSKVDDFLLSISQNEQLTELEPIVKSLGNFLKETSKKSLPKIMIPTNSLPLNLKVSITSFYPSSVVQNLNAIDTNLWKQVCPTQSWDLSQLQPLLIWGKRLNSLVYTKILDGQSLSQRVDHLTRFLDICDELYSNKEDFTNFNSLLSILDVICDLQKTILWKGVSLDKKNKLNELLKLFETNFIFCSEQIKNKIAQQIPFIPPAAVYNFFAIRWSEKQNLIKKGDQKLGETQISLRQLSNTSQFFEAVFRVHESSKTFMTQETVLDFLFSEVMSDRDKDNALSELTSPEYLDHEWFKAIQNNDTQTVGIILAKDPKFLTKKDGEGKNCLHHVAEANMESMLKFLLNYNRSIELSLFVEEKNTNPISIASRKGYINILSILLSYYESWSKKISDYKKIRLNCEKEHPSSTIIWELWLSGGSKSLESEFYPVYTETPKKLFPWQRETTAEIDVPQLDWNKFEKNFYAPLPPDPVFQAIDSLILSEQQYLKELVILIRVIKPFTGTLSLSQTDIDTLFNGIMLLLSFHKDLLENYLLLTNSVNCCLPFDAFSNKFEMMKTYYLLYTQNYDKQMKIVKKLRKLSKSSKLPLNFPNSAWKYFSIPIKRMNEYSQLLNNIYNYLPEDKKIYSDLLKNIEELYQSIRTQICKFETETISSNLANQNILNNGKIALKVGKYYNTLKSKYCVYLLQKDCLYCLTRKTNLIYANRNLYVEEEYPICSIIKAVPSKEKYLKIFLYPRGNIELEIEDKYEVIDWAQMITKLKHDWSNENNNQKLVQKFVSSKIDEETLAKYWNMHSKEKPENWIVLGDLYKRKKETTRAITCYETALSHDPNSYKALYKMAKVYLDIGNTKRGFHYLEQINVMMQNTTMVDFYLSVKVTEFLQMHDATRKIPLLHI